MKNKCMSIGEFCSNLNVSFNLFPKQKEILDTFYGGNYRELIAILGRRSGKDTLAAIIVLYETYRLLQTGDPFKYYKIAPLSPIYIMALSCSSDQSRILFCEIKAILSSCDLLEINKQDADKVYFKTKNDKSKTGSVCIISGHSESQDLLGKRIFALILNEATSFKNPDRVLSCLSPGTCDFKPKGKGSLDSHIITLSSAGASENIICKLMQEPHDNRLVFQLPTWEVSTRFSRDMLKREFKFLSEEEFDCEFGSIFRSPEPNQTISLRLSNTQIETLKRMARLQAYGLDTDINYIDLIRTSVDQYISMDEKVQSLLPGKDQPLLDTYRGLYKKVRVPKFKTRV